MNLTAEIKEVEKPKILKNKKGEAIKGYPKDFLVSSFRATIRFPQTHIVIAKAVGISILEAMEEGNAEQVRKFTNGLVEQNEDSQLNFNAIAKFVSELYQDIGFKIPFVKPKAYNEIMLRETSLAHYNINHYAARFNLISRHLGRKGVSLGLALDSGVRADKETLDEMIDIAMYGIDSKGRKLVISFFRKFNDKMYRDEEANNCVFELKEYLKNLNGAKPDSNVFRKYTNQIESVSRRIEVGVLTEMRDLSMRINGQESKKENLVDSNMIGKSRSKILISHHDKTQFIIDEIDFEALMEIYDF